MRSNVFICGLLVCFASGCASGFEGEWLEDAGQHDTGNMLTEGGERRMALKFDTPAWVQTGLYLDHMGVVDDETQQKIDVVKQRLIKYFGYNEASATDVLNYVASIFARGDTKQDE